MHKNAAAEAFWVHGDMEVAYFGAGAWGALGYPVSDSYWYPFFPLYVRQNFEDGWICWSWWWDIAYVNHGDPDLGDCPS
jgi:hypothetical protein